MSSGIALIIARRRGAALLRRLVERGDSIRGCIIMNDDAHEEPWADRISDLAQESGIAHVIARSFQNEGARSALHSWKPAAVIAENWRTMVPPEVYESVPSFVVLHESLLPKYRGFAPLSWPIINGETTTGVTLFHIAREVDAGDIVEQAAISIDLKSTVNDLYEKTIPVCCDLVERNLAALIAGDAPRIGQNHSEATYACARTPEDGKISWSDSTAKTYNLIRALQPPLMPGAWTTWGDSRLVIASARPIETPAVYVGRIPGRVVELGEKFVKVLTGDGLLEIETVIASDAASPVSASQVLRSVRTRLG
ncbi:MAG: hypothetical protein M3Y72_13650 [Acidobacteriota bacterium]|nr:hypothetical protein [Acidobacteriota bacterium]